MSLIADFIEDVKATYATHKATEHSYRPALKTLFDGLTPNEISVTNEPKRIACGAPDFIMQSGDIAIGFVEAKDIGLNLRSMKDANKAQQQRYLAALPNLIYTNCLDWDFYRNGQLVASATIADYAAGIQAKPDQYGSLENLLKDFIAQRPQTITSPKELAQIMAGKSALIKDVLGNTLKVDQDLQTELGDQYKVFRQHLIHDIKPDEFADIYAETIAYGMFAARLHDQTLDTFTRSEALDLLPKSNPFLRNLFSYIAGPNLDDRIRWIIDDLAKVFQAANVKKIMENFGKLTGQSDPFLHFYETFLAAYNPAKRKARGVWYTPEPVVNFIVRAVDQVLQNEFGLSDGIADTSKVTIDWETGQSDKKGKAIKIKKEVHRVQILDPATGTGTFLAEVIKQIAPKVKGVAESMWSQYVERDLVPRIHGFELLMASYAMCHMKLDMILTEMGYKPTGKPSRLSVYLTNSLEEGEPANQTLPFAQWLSNEAKEANTIKRDMPIMCVIGNPPYSISSSNKGKWISSLTRVYKDGLEEKSINALSDDYVKFIRLSEHFISKNNIGVFAMITNNSFTDGIVHRNMRLHLRKTFDEIFVINLHGDSNKKEKTPEGKPDKNVFDIMQGVSITLAIKKSDSKDLASVYIKDLWGDRDTKYEYLWNSSINKSDFSQANYQETYNFFTSRPFKNGKEYAKGFALDDLFDNGLSGIKFRKDNLLVTKNFSSADARQMVDDVSKLGKAELKSKYDFEETPDWKIDLQRTNFENPKDEDFIRIAYRPFDYRHTFYPLDKINKIIPRGDSRYGLMKHMLLGENIALICGRQNKSQTVDHFFVTNIPSEMKTGESTIQSYHFPLYLYQDQNDLEKDRRSNLNNGITEKIRKIAKSEGHEPNDLQIFDYVYGTLYSPDYRSNFTEFLKIEFPRIPWPNNAAAFWDISQKGTSLRRLHLMETDIIGATPYMLKGEGDLKVDKPRYEQGSVWINQTQHFTEVPKVAWDFSIGGYQPAQKWLKDRRGRELTFDDLKHYQRIVKILGETARIMKSITLPLDSTSH